MLAYTNVEVPGQCKLYNWLTEILLHTRMNFGFQTTKCKYTIIVKSHSNICISYH